MTTGLSQDEIAAIVRRSNPKMLTEFELSVYQDGIDSAIIWKLGNEIGAATVALIEQGKLTRARRSYCRAPTPLSAGSPPPVPERHRTRTRITTAFIL